jgi:hypothetical protein
MKKTALTRRSALKAQKGWGVVHGNLLGGKQALKRKNGLKKAKRRTKTPARKLKDRLWELCKQITRLKYGRHCYTCPARDLEGSNCHTGHFITDATCSTELSYDLRNLRVQCYHCNVNLSGNWVVFEQRLTQNHGSDYVAELKSRNIATKGLRYDILWYQAKVVEYEKILADLS